MMGYVFSCCLLVDRARLTARRATGPGGSADFLDVAIGDVITASARRNTFLPTVGPKSDAVEAGRAVSAVLAEPVLATDRDAANERDFTNRSGCADAVAVEAGRASPVGRACAFFLTVTVDVDAERSDCRAVELLVAGPMDAGAEARAFRRRFAGVAHRAILVEDARDSAVDAVACFAGEAGDAIEAVVASRRGLDAAKPLQRNIQALVARQALARVVAGAAW